MTRITINSTGYDVSIEDAVLKLFEDRGVFLRPNVNPLPTDPEIMIAICQQIANIVNGLLDNAGASTIRLSPFARPLPYSTDGYVGLNASGSGAGTISSLTNLEVRKLADVLCDNGLLNVQIKEMFVTGVCNFNKHPNPPNRSAGLFNGVGEPRLAYVSLFSDVLVNEEIAARMPAPPATPAAAL